MLCVAGKNNIAVKYVMWLRAQYNELPIGVIPNGTDECRDTWQLSLKRYASQHHIPIVSWGDVKNIENLILLSLECDRIISINQFKSSNLYNLHFSLLPRYRGVYTSAWPILNGEDYTGVSLHKIDSGIDTGPIINQRRIKIEREETAFSLYHKYEYYGLKLLKRNTSNILSGNISLLKQEHENASYYSRKSIDYDDLKLNLAVSAVELSRQVRAFYFPPFQLPKIYELSVGRPKILAEASRFQAGKILFANERKIILSTLDNNIQLDIFKS